MLDVTATASCSSAKTAMAKGKGLKLVWKMKTANVVATGTEIRWFNAETSGDAATYKFKATFGSGSGFVSCGSYEHASTVALTTSKLVMVAPITNAKYSLNDGAPACPKGDITLTVRDWNNDAVEADKDKKFKVNCYVCDNAGNGDNCKDSVLDKDNKDKAKTVYSWVVAGNGAD